MNPLVTIDYVIIVAYFILTIIIGLAFTKSAGKDMSHFFLGGRNLTWYMAGLSMVATTFAADTPLAVTELVIKNGISGNWLWWNMLASGMLTTFFFAHLWRRAEVLTEPELIELRYSGKEAKFLRGFKALYLGFFIDVLIIGWVNVAMISILEVFFEMPHSTAFACTAAMMLFVAVYSSLSGLMGVVLTDAIQFVIAMTGCIILAYITLNSGNIGGIEGLKTKLPEWTLQMFPTVGNSNQSTASSLAIGVGTFLAYVGVQWWASWYPGAEPGGGGYVAQRFMSTKTEKDAVYATLFFQIAHYCLRPWPWIIVALCSIVLYPSELATSPKNTYILAMKDFMPNGLRGLMLVAFFAAYMSTIATQLNWGASYLVNDIYNRFINQKATQKQLVNVSRIVTLLLMFTGLITSSFINSISGVWSFIIECGAGLGLVLILRWYWWRINAYSEIVATITPFIVYACCKYANVPYPNSFFITVAITTIAWIIATFITKPTNPAQLQIFYDKVKPAGAWNQFHKLTQTDNNNKLFPLFICWIGGIILTYAILITTGKLIFGFYNQAIIGFVIAILGFILLQIGLKKANY